MKQSAVNVRRRLSRECCGDQGKWARDHGFSATYVSLVLSGQKEPSTRMAEVLGFQKRIIRTVEYTKL